MVINALTEKGRTLVKKIAIFQSVITFLFTILTLIFKGEISAISVAAGGLVCIIPGLIFGFFAFRFAGASQNRVVVRSFSQGSKIKFMLTLVFFASCMQWNELSVGAMLLGFIVPTVTQWPYMIFSRHAN